MGGICALSTKHCNFKKLSPFAFILLAMIDEDGYCTNCQCYHVGSSLGDKYEHPTICPKDQHAYVPLFMYGAAGTGVGTRIKGTARRGGRKMREQHMRYGVVGMTNEYRSSQTCAWCFQQLRPARARREVNGQPQIVRLHGALECTNPLCVSVLEGHTIKSRDHNAALCIALAGGSTVLDHTTLEPFARSIRPVPPEQPEQNKSSPGL